MANRRFGRRKPMLGLQRPYRRGFSQRGIINRRRLWLQQMKEQVSARLDFLDRQRQDLEEFQRMLDKSLEEMKKKDDEQEGGQTENTDQDLVQSLRNQVNTLEERLTDLMGEGEQDIPYWRNRFRRNWFRGR